MRASFLIPLAAIAACLPGQKPLPPAQQVALAVLPLPQQLRAGATVLGYDNGLKLVTLRKGTGSMVCLATDPRDKVNMHVACYHQSLDPFMARGRELRAKGANTNTIDSTREAEGKAGKILLPKQGGALWQLTCPWSAVNVAQGTVDGSVKVQYELYMPFATGASLGVPDQPITNGPWVMEPGTVKAHLMFTPSM